MAERIGCVDVAEVADPHGDWAPIRGNAATSGVTCSLGSAELHLFDRSPTGEENHPDKSGAWAQGGTVENIRRLVGADFGDQSSDCTAYLLIGDEWFVVSSDRAVLDDVKRKLGGDVEPVAKVSPPASYDLPGCDGS